MLTICALGKSPPQPLRCGANESDEPWGDSEVNATQLCTVLYTIKRDDKKLFSEKVCVIFVKAAMQSRYVLSFTISFV